MKRNDDIDFLKSVMILLMVCFHLTFASQSFPDAKTMVYTFHMPVFLIISGFLVNVNKPTGKYLKGLLKLLIPYIIMESGYTVMASVLPIAEHIENLTPTVFLDKLLLHPLGPYWYLHTMVLCSLAYYITCRLLPRLPYLSPLLSTLIIWGLSECGIISFACGAYFFAGALLRLTRKDLTYFFRASWFSAIPFFVLCMLPECQDKATIGGIAIVFFSISLCRAIFRSLGKGTGEVMLWIGRNTMPIFLFAPLFTILCKQLIPLLPHSIPQSLNGILFITISIPVCVAGSIAVDKAKTIAFNCLGSLMK